MQPFSAQLRRAKMFAAHPFKKFLSYSAARKTLGKFGPIKILTDNDKLRRTLLSILPQPIRSHGGQHTNALENDPLSKSARIEDPLASVNIFAAYLRHPHRA